MMAAGRSLSVAGSTTRPVRQSETADRDMRGRHGGCPSGRGPAISRRRTPNFRHYREGGPFKRCKKARSSGVARLPAFARPSIDLRSAQAQPNIASHIAPMATDTAIASTPARPSDHNAETNLVRGNATGHEVQLGGSQLADFVCHLQVHDQSPSLIGQTIPPRCGRLLAHGTCRCRVAGHDFSVMQVTICRILPGFFWHVPQGTARQGHRIPPPLRRHST